MSIQAVAWVLDCSESRGLDRLVLIALANHANDDAVCWPAQRTIAREAGIGTGTVSEAIQRLVGTGEVEIVERGGVRKSATYRLPLVIFARELSAVRGPGVSAVRGPGPRRTIRNHQEDSYAQQPSKAARDLLRCEKHPHGFVGIDCACARVVGGQQSQ